MNGDAFCSLRNDKTTPKHQLTAFKKGAKAGKTSFYRRNVRNGAENRQTYIQPG